MPPCFPECMGLRVSCFGTKFTASLGSRLIDDGKKGDVLAVWKPSDAEDACRRLCPHCKPQDECDKLCVIDKYLDLDCLGQDCSALGLLCSAH